MLKFYIIAAVLLFGGKILKGRAEEDDEMRVFSYTLHSDGLQHLAEEIEKIKSSMEILKIHSELEQVRSEQLLMKLDILINKTKEAENSVSNEETPWWRHQELKESGEDEAKEVVFSTTEKSELDDQWVRYDELRRYVFEEEPKKFVEDESTETGSTSEETDLSLGYFERLWRNPMRNFPSNCGEALSERSQRSGIYFIKFDGFGPDPFAVYCDAIMDGGNWTVIQRRLDGSVNFKRGWNEYRRGFGNLRGEFFIGLDKLNAMTEDSPHELLVELEDFENQVRYAKYDLFAIGDSDEDFALKTLGVYSGDAGDSLRTHESMKFTTIDKDNDFKLEANCAEEYHGGWWYNKCHDSNPNGKYLGGEYEFSKEGEGIDWFAWRGHQYSMKSVQMLIRPKV